MICIQLTILTPTIYLKFTFDIGDLYQSNFCAVILHSLEISKVHMHFI